MLTELLSDAEFWVGVALVAFIALMVYFKVPAAITGLLDSRGAKIQAQLDEASALRAEAQTLLADIKVRRETAEKAAAAMLANAKDEAERLLVDSRVKLEEDIARRRALAERKIATAEAQAAADVKAAAADLAAQAAESILAARIAGATSDPLIDQALAKLGSQFQ